MEHSVVQLGYGLAVPEAEKREDARIIRLFGTRRSGNHVILQWIVDNLEFKTRVHFDQARIGFRPEHSGSCQIGKERFAPRRGMTEKQARLYVNSIKSADLFTMFYEEQNLGPDFLEFPNLTTGYDHLPARNVIVVRDFLNWLASVKRHPAGLGGSESAALHQASVVISTMVSWKITVKRAFGLFPQARDFTCTTIIFDKWVASPAYRQEIADELKLSGYCPDVPSTVARYGGGSSFSGVSETPKPEDVRQRWKEYVGNRDFSLLLQIACNDAELVQLLEDYFPDNIEIIRAHFPDALKR